MSTKQELRDQIGRLGEGYKEWRDTAISLRDELDDARATIARLSDQLAARDAATIAPRAFRVGDRVRVAEGATWKDSFGKAASYASGKEGVVGEVHEDGDLWIDGLGYTSPEFCTLIVDDSEAVLPLPEGYAIATPADPAPGVMIVMPDGSQLWIPCEKPDLDEDAKGLWVMPEGRGGEAVAWVNPAAIVAAVVTR